MTSKRKKELARLILRFFAYCALTLVMFFMCFAIPPAALAAPAALWTFYGFEILQFITKTKIEMNKKKLASTLNFLFFLSAEFALPWVIELGDGLNTMLFRSAAIVVFAAVCVAEIVFWKRFLKAHFKTFKENWRKTDMDEN